MTSGLLEAKAAKVAARAGLLAAIDRGATVRAIAEQVNEHGRRNHFGDLFAETMQRRRT